MRTSSLGQEVLEEHVLLLRSSYLQLQAEQQVFVCSAAQRASGTADVGLTLTKARVVVSSIV